MVNKRKTPMSSAKPARTTEIVQVPPEEAKRLLALAMDAVIAMQGKALREFSKYWSIRSTTFRKGPMLLN